MKSEGSPESKAATNRRNAIRQRRFAKTSDSASEETTLEAAEKRPSSTGRFRTFIKKKPARPSSAPPERNDEETTTGSPKRLLARLARVKHVPKKSPPKAGVTKRDTEQVVDGLDAQVETINETEMALAAASVAPPAAAAAAAASPNQTLDFRSLDPPEQVAVEASWDANKVLFNEFQGDKKNKVKDSINVFQGEWAEQGDNAVSFSAAMMNAADSNDDSTSARRIGSNQEEEKKEKESLTVSRFVDPAAIELDIYDWQMQAGGAVLQGHNVILCAPTGAGKTVAGEMALRIAFTMQGKHAIYTTPLKALSNQKYGDLCPMFGKENVGLSTGDISINKGAPVTVMTTEVYRNIAWKSTSGNKMRQEGQIRRRSSDNDLTENGVVVLDEFHYMGHPGRGGVWEESVITSPAHTQIVGLSATLPNAPQLAAWMENVTGRRTVLINISGTKPRPVPLRYMFATKEGLYPLFRDSEAGPGAPKGLLGLRGEGEFASSKRNQKTGKGIQQERQTNEFENQKLPRGLQINPQLKAAAEKRLQKVNRAIERKKVQQKLDIEDDSEYQERDWGVGRGKRRPMPKRVMSPRDEKRERERLLRQELRRSVPSLPVLLKRLDQKDMLPAIFFIFSRAGCEEAARNACNFMRGPSQEMSVDSPTNPFDDDDRGRKKRKTRRRGRSRIDAGDAGEDIVQDAKGRMFRLSNNYVSDDLLEASINEIFEDGGETLDEEDPLSRDNFDVYARSGLLTYKEVELVAAKIESFNEENNEIAFPNDIMMQYLFGVGSHHAGMLP